MSTESIITPEDQEDEAEEAARNEFYSELYPQFPASMSVVEKEKLADWLWDYVNHVFSSGYEQAQEDAASFGLEYAASKSRH